jgi:YidC/Oxa1 family membrane protein insertase
VLLKIPFFLALFWAFYSTAFLGIASDPANNTSFLWVSGRVTGAAFDSSALVRRLVDSNLLVVDKQETQKRGEGAYVWNAVLQTGEKPLNDILKEVRADKPQDVKAEDIEKIREGLAPLLPDLSDEDVKSIIVAWNNTNTLGKPERIETPFGRISLLALLIGITTFLMQKTMPGAGGQQAQLMGMFMPVFITFICWNFPAGVQLYWLVSNAVGALQQYLIMRSPKRRARKKGAKT